MPFNRLARFLCLSLAIFWLPASSTAQTPQRDQRPRNCAISGRVTINGQPGAGVQVTAVEIPANWNSPLPARLAADGSPVRKVHKVRADGGGRYQFTSLPPGRYQLGAASRVFVAAAGSSLGPRGQPGQEDAKTVTLDDGESRENVDFALLRGGVITGRVTDAEGRPVVAHHVTLLSFSPDSQQKFQHFRSDFRNRRTDDRGVYRIYGLPAGSYVVGAGGEDQSSPVKYPRIYHPNAGDEKQAKVIELKAGDEVAGVDIRLATSKRLYEVAGRVVEVETGKPVATVTVICFRIAGNEEGESGGDNASAQTDRLGNFRLTGLGRGRFRAGIGAEWMETTDFYAEATSFEIAGGDLGGIEIKAARGGAISGLAVVDGVGDPAIKSKLAQTFIYAHTEIRESADQNDQPFSFHQTTIRADGTFRIAGIAPGKISLGVASPAVVMNKAGGRLRFLRIERGGARIESYIELAGGEQINDLRLVFTQASGFIRGQVQIAGGQLPQGWQLSVRCHSPANPNLGFSAQVDEKGRFVIEGIPGGEYELSLTMMSPAPDGSGGFLHTTGAKQKVTVANERETQVTIPFDPNRKQQEEQR